MILAAYGIRKAYKKHEAKKAQRKLLERGDHSAGKLGSSNDIRLTSPLSSRRPSAHLGRSSNGRLVRYGSSNSASATHVEPIHSSARSDYSASIYSQPGMPDPLDEIRQYQQYISSQSNEFEKDAEPPSYEHATSHRPKQLPSQNTHWNTAGGWMQRPHESPSASHEPQSPSRITELDTSSESSAGTGGRRGSATQPMQRTLDLADLEPQSAAGAFSAGFPTPLRIGKPQEQPREGYVLPAAPGAGPARKRSRHLESNSDSEDGDDQRDHMARPWETAERTLRTG